MCPYVVFIFESSCFPFAADSALCVLGYRGSVTVQRERGRCDDRQEEAVWLAGPDFGQIRSHGQWLLCVRNRHIISPYYHPLLM